MDELHFSIEGEFITNVARSWFWDEDKPYEKSEELLMSCMCGGSDTEKRVTCQDIIEGRKKLVGINEFELVDDNENVRPISKKNRGAASKTTEGQNPRRYDCQPVKLRR